MRHLLPTPLVRKTLAALVSACVLASTAVSADEVEGDPIFNGTIAPTLKDSVPDWPDVATAPDNAPNIVIILIDDIGFADTSTFGGLADTPALEAMAAQGLIFNNFNVTGMCSPTRASLLTGHNHHRTGFASISEYANGFPGYDSYWKRSTASVAEVLRQNGYNTAAIGKWHNTPPWEISQAGPFDRWPTGLGFEYFYGFMGSEDNQWEPDRLYEGTRPIDAPSSADDGYHLTQDLADRAMAWIGEQRSVAPEKPYFLYFATGGVHTPHHVPEEWIERFHGKFDGGWDMLREDIFARQKRLGIVPADAVLTARPVQIPAWEDLSLDEQRLYARQMEVYAAFVSYTDHHVGRLMEAANARDENTLIFYIVGDNGAVGSILPGYGGITTLADDLDRLDLFGGPDVPYNQSQGGWGWMGNTPFKYWKTVASHFGALRTPMVVTWPGKLDAPERLRSHFTHITDIAPTIYEAVGLTPPATVSGVNQQPLDGVSLLPSLSDAESPAGTRTQYFELLGNRAIYQDGWIASALNAYNSPDGTAEDWELYNLETDFTQAKDVAEQYPGKLVELIDLFDREAEANLVFPLGGAAYRRSTKPFAANTRKRFDFYKGASRIARSQLPEFDNSFTLEADVIIPAEGGSGSLASFGFRNKGFAFYLKDGRVVFENRAGVDKDIIVGEQPVAAGRQLLRAEFTCDVCDAQRAFFEPISGQLRLFVGDQLVAEDSLDVVNLRNAGESFSLDIGRAGGSRISDSYAGAFPFNGTLERLSILLE